MVITMNYYLDRVKVEDKDILYRLLQYSLFEESANDLNEPNDRGEFVYRHFEDYFTDDTRDAFLIKEVDSNKLLGFVMVNSYVEKIDEGKSIAEYLVLPKYRRNKIGKRVAFDVFNMYKGKWEVKPSYNSESAYLFWKNVCESYTNGNVEFIDDRFVFENN